jgi:hypothetical protein
MSEDFFIEIFFPYLKESAADKAKRKANKEIKEMAERLSADQSIIVSTNLFYYLYLKANFRVTCIRNYVWYFYECNALVIN